MPGEVEEPLNMSSWDRVEAKAGPGQRVQAGSSAEPAYQWDVP